ncbi:hypothetical protein AVEN_129262-1 [Araneus ventricosus]|uniref:Uncharacterized protein n=1 Tax=Araneus ventricosus TaxID=182803 RepID=A0A4Y2HM48_ARAVE|nr:hypothetical protein AVEN_129262-1 [Araneus ventricosus]
MVHLAADALQPQARISIFPYPKPNGFRDFFTIFSRYLAITTRRNKTATPSQFFCKIHATTGTLFQGIQFPEVYTQEVCSQEDLLFAFHLLLHKGAEGIVIGAGNSGRHFYSLMNPDIDLDVRSSGGNWRPATCPSSQRKRTVWQRRYNGLGRHHVAECTNLHVLDKSSVTAIRFEEEIL